MRTPYLRPGLLLDKVRDTVAERGATYSDPSTDFTRTAGIWTGLFHEYLKTGVAFKPEDVAKAMIGLKLSRAMNQAKEGELPNADNILDIYGYAYCMELMQGRRLPYWYRVVGHARSLVRRFRFMVQLDTDQ